MLSEGFRPHLGLAKGEIETVLIVVYMLHFTMSPSC